MGALLTQEDAFAFRQVPASENAFLDIKDFVKKIDDIRVDTERNITSDREFLDEWQPFKKYLPILITCSKKRYLIVDAKLEGPFHAVTPEPVTLSKWVLAMCWLADVSAKKSDLPRSSELLTAAAKLATMLRHEPDFEAIEIRSEASMAIDRELSLLITARGKDPAWQALIEKVIALLDPPYDLRPCYKYEHWITLHEVELRLGEVHDSPLTNKKVGERFIPRYGRATKSRIHELYGKMLKQYPTDIEDYQRIYKLNSALFEDLDYHSMSLKSFYYSLSGHSTSIYDVQREIARRNAVAQALAIVKGKLNPAEGLPLKGKRELDVDGHPLRIKKLAKGWVIYSVGNDGADNGGSESIRLPNDWVVHLPK